MYCYIMNYTDSTIEEVKVEDSFCKNRSVEEILDELNYDIDSCYLMCSNHRIDIYRIDLTNK